MNDTKTMMGKVLPDESVIDDLTLATLTIILYTQ